MKVAEKMEQLGILAPDTAILLPKVCPRCLIDLEINNTLTEITCINPFCIDKLVRRAVSMCTYLDIKNVGESFFYHFFNATEIRYVSEIMMLEREDANFFFNQFQEYADEVDVSLTTLENNFFRLVDALVPIRENLTMIDYLRALSLPHIQSRSTNMLEGYQSFEELYDDLDAVMTISDINNILGFSNGSMVSTIKIAESLATYREEILLYEKHFDFKTVDLSGYKLKIVCSTAVGQPFRSKRDFYRKIDEVYGNKVAVTWSESATRDCDLLIWAGADGTPASITSKVNKINGYNMKGSHIPILTAGQFIDILDNSPDGETIKRYLDNCDIVEIL